MHGELIELNERLQKSIQNKDGVIKRMRAELEDLRGPVSSFMFRVFYEGVI